jgi:hypothetical protein
LTNFNVRHESGAYFYIIEETRGAMWSREFLMELFAKGGAR